MRRARPQPLSPMGALGRGAAAGVAGTIAMDLFQFARQRRRGAREGFFAWEFPKLERFEEAPAPAKAGKRLYEALFVRELGDDRAGLVNTVMHFGYGVTWGALFGLLAGSAARGGPLRGPLYGLAIFLDDYALLSKMGLYEPIWHYDAATLAKDAADHAVYGTATGFVFEVLAAPARRRAATRSRLVGCGQRKHPRGRQRTTRGPGLPRLGKRQR